MAHITVPEDPNNGRSETVVGGTPQDEFNFTFPYFDDADITVYIDGDATEDFTVTGTGSAVDGGYSSGTVTLDDPVSNVTVVIEREVALARTEDFPYPSATFNIKALNTALDRVYAIFQQFRRKLTRALRQPVADTTDIDALPVAATRATKVLAFDADGDPIVSSLTLAALEAQPAASEASAALAAASAVTAAASATAAQTAETNAGTAEMAAEAAQAAAEAAAASVPSFPIDPNDTTFAATKRVLGRNTTGAGTGEEVTLTQLLDWIGSAAQGDILFRDAAAWARLAAGTSGHFLKTQGAGANPTWAAPSATGITIGTMNAGSGTAIQFTGIPTTAKLVGLTFQGLSTNTGGTDNFLIQIGPSGGVATSGYVGGGFATGGTNTGTAGLQWLTNGAARNATGIALFVKMDASTNRWAGIFISVDTVGPEFAYGATSIPLSGDLERGRITTTGGSTIDAGNVNLFYL